MYICYCIGEDESDYEEPLEEELLPQNRCNSAVMFHSLCVAKGIPNQSLLVNMQTGSHFLKEILDTNR